VGSNSYLEFAGEPSASVLLTNTDEDSFWFGIKINNGTLVMDGCILEHARVFSLGNTDLKMKNTRISFMQLDGMILNNCTGIVSSLFVSDNPGMPVICNIDSSIPTLSSIHARGNLLNMVWIKGKNLLVKDLDLPAISIPYLLQSNIVNDKQTLLITKRSGVAGYIEYNSKDPRVVSYFSSQR